MIISHKYKFIFFHVPKTAGTSISNALKPYCEVFNLNLVTQDDLDSFGIDKKYLGSPFQHLPAKEIRKIVGEEIWNSYFKFGFVRNPWDKVVSHYHYVLKEESFDKNNIKFADLRKKVVAYSDFKEYVKEHYKNTHKNVNHQLLDDGKIIVDFVGKYESLQEDFDKICKKVGLPRILLSHENKTKHANYMSYYDESSKEIIRKAFKKEIDIFNYSFDNKIETNKLKIKIAHVVNPVKVTKESDLFIAQPITFETMRIAKEFDKSLNVELLSCQYHEDGEIVPDFFKKTSDLRRSSLDIKNFNVKRKLPLLRDILDKAYNESNADYIIYTNVDIALMPYFYSSVKNIIDQGYDSFVINKRIIPTHYTNVSEIPLMFSEYGLPHPGFDCFVFKRELYPKFKIGDVCIGIPNVDYSLIANMVAYSNKFKLFEDLHVTFHIGDEMQLKSSSFSDYHEHNKNEVVSVYKRFEREGFFDRKPLIEDLWLQFNGKKRIWNKLWGDELVKLGFDFKTMDEAAYILNHKLKSHRNHKEEVSDLGNLIKRVAFIDHSYHNKTKSASFFIDLLKKRFDVDIYYDRSWIKGSRYNLSEIISKNYDCIIYWQILPNEREINKLDAKKVILVPMYDGVHHFYDHNWLTYKKFRFINFSKKVHDFLTEIGIESYYFKYFVKPNYSNKETNNGLIGFFWQRKDDLDWKTIRKLIESVKFKKFYFHKSPDPDSKMKFALPSKEDIEKYNIEFTKWKESKKDYDAIISESNVFFCSRLYEGIGLAFIEAMSLGKCIVSPNNSTMNEYIIDGFNGLLYDHNNPKPLDFSQVREIQKNTFSFVVEGYDNWVKSEGNILDLIELGEIQEQVVNEVSIGKLKDINNRLKILNQAV